MSYTVTSRELVRQVPTATEPHRCDFKDTLTPDERKTIIMEKDKRIELRVTPADKAKIERLAKICGLSLSEYLRQRALGYAPRAVLPDVFFDFHQTLCRLCDEVADKVSPETEQKLLEVADAIQRQLLLPAKSSAQQIKREALTGSPRSLLCGEKEHPWNDNPFGDSSANDMSGV